MLFKLYNPGEHTDTNTLNYKIVSSQDVWMMKLKNLMSRLKKIKETKKSMTTSAQFDEIQQNLSTIVK